MAGPAESRRSFLRFLAASPLLGANSVARAMDALTDTGEPTDSAASAIDVFDLEASAQARMPPAHFGYIQTGTNGDGTVRANRTGFDKFYLRARRLVDVSRINMRLELFGETYASPIVLCPVGSQKGFHADGELASARAARRGDHLQILSNVSSTAVEEVAKARAAPVWQQLYPTGRWDVAHHIMRRAEAAGCPAIVLTVDLPAGGRARNTLTRAIQKDGRNCSNCHDNPEIAGGEKPMYAGLGLTGRDWPQAALTWSFIDRMRDATSMKILVKGIVTAEDAVRCVEKGVDGIVVSNHGGRADDSGRGAIESLAEIAPVVGEDTVLIMDSGVRRGTDIVKALALGADAVGVGRPYVWGLGAFGERGVVRALELLREELETTMQFVGAATVSDIGSGTVGRHG